eukprot:scaffold20819_cov108-Isochrysis_galbana.AAC.4
MGSCWPGSTSRLSRGSIACAAQKLSRERWDTRCGRSAAAVDRSAPVAAPSPRSRVPYHEHGGTPTHMPSVAHPSPRQQCETTAASAHSPGISRASDAIGTSNRRAPCRVS